MAISAQDVKKLREQTGCGMMECKTALTDANGDLSRQLSFSARRDLPRQRKRPAVLPPRGTVVTWQHRRGQKGLRYDRGKCRDRLCRQKREIP